jgi:2-oxoglutarate dehydrogenase E2 component (dihydrolipoamide succinyltransferase)
MNVLGSGSASSRRTIVAAGLLAAVFGAAVTAQAQQAPAPAPAAPAQAEPAPAPDAFKFTSDAALVIWVVKADKTGDFEAAWGEVIGKLAASGKADLKSIADSIKIYKADGPATPDGVTYFFDINPVAKASTYNPSFLLFSSGVYEREQALEVFNRINGAINPQGGIRPIPLVAVGAGAAPAAAPAPAAPAPEAPAPAAPPAQ